MRLTPDQKAVIRATVEAVLSSYQVTIGVFGSRLNTSARGGDVDLIIRSDAAVPLQLRARLKLRLEDQLGLPVDLVFVSGNKQPTAFQAMVSDKARPIDEAST